MATVNTLEVKITGDDSNLQRTLTRSTLVIAKWGAAAATAAAAVAGQLVRSTTTALDRIDKLSISTGIATDELQKLEFAASQTGVSFDRVTNAVSYLQRQMVQNEQVKAFADALDLREMDTPAQLRTIADMFAGITDPAERSAVAAQLFGRSAGPEMLRMLNQGGQGIQQLMNRAEELGLVLDQTAIDAAVKLSDAFDEVTKTLTATVRSGVMSALTDDSGDLNEAFTDLRNILTSPEFLQGMQFLVTSLVNLATLAARTANRAFEMGIAFRQALRGIDPESVLELETAIKRYEEMLQRLRTTNVMGTNQEQDYADAIERTEAKLAELRATLAELRGEQEQVRGSIDETVPALERMHDVLFGGGDADGREAVARFREQLEGRLQAIRHAGMEESEIQQELYEERLEQLQEFLEQSEISEEEYREMREQLAREHASRMADIAQKEADDRAAIESRVQQQILAMRQAALSSAVGLLQTLGSESKTAAIAAIALNKGLMIAQTIQNTAAAQMRAYAELGPIAGPPAAAKIGVLGRIQAGIIAATGLVQAAGVGRGGAAAGSPGGVPVATTSGTAGGTMTSGGTGGTQQVATINIAGENFSRGQVVSLIESINELAEDGVRLVVN